MTYLRSPCSNTRPPRNEPPRPRPAPPQNHAPPPDQSPSPPRPAPVVDPYNPLVHEDTSKIYRTGLRYIARYN